MKYAPVAKTRLNCFVRSLILLLIFRPFILIASQSDLELTGDYLQIAIPLTALATSYYFEDENTPDSLGYRSFLKSFTYGFAATHGIKTIIEKRRPNGENEQSFPSGHTFAAFSGASFISSRFGNKWGVPAYLLAGVVGYSRVKEKFHYADDVLSGAMIAFLFNKYVTEDDGPKVNLVFSPENVQLIVSTPIEKSKSSPSELELYFFLGPSYLQNIILNDDDRVDYDLSKFPNDENSVATSQIELRYKMDQKNRIHLTLDPYEQFITGPIKQSIRYGQKTFLINENLKMNWIQYCIDLEYLRSVAQQESFDFYIGLGLFAKYARLEIKSEDTSLDYHTERRGAVGNLIGRFQYRNLRNLNSSLQLNWYKDSDTKYIKANMDIWYQMNKKWSTLFRLQRQEQQIEIGENNSTNGEVEINSRSSFNLVLVGIGYVL